MERFITSYVNVFKKQPKITKSIRNNWHNVEGLGNAHPISWAQVSMYYNWCLKQKVNPLKITKEICEHLDSWLSKKFVNKKSLSIILQVSPSYIRENLKTCEDIWEAYKVCISRGTKATQVYTY